MHTLKYRAYIKPLKRYAEKYETILYHHQCNMEPSWTVNVSPEEYYGDEELIIEQFTGLLDRNGKEIYEGDIVEIDKYGKFQIIWNEWSCKFDFDKIGKREREEPLLSQDWEEKSEVIGNIHESPELAEAK